MIFFLLLRTSLLNRLVFRHLSHDYIILKHCYPSLFLKLKRKIIYLLNIPIFLFYVLKLAQRRSFEDERRRAIGRPPEWGRVTLSKPGKYLSCGVWSVPPSAAQSGGKALAAWQVNRCGQFGQVAGRNIRWSLCCIAWLRWRDAMFSSLSLPL